MVNPIGVSWIGIVFGLGFVLAFGYWTTNFAEVQRALSAKDISAAQRTPLIGAIPKLFLPFIMILPGMIALVVIPKLGTTDALQYNNAVPLLMNRYLPNGMLGIALTGLMASFMAGVAANVSAFNTVVTTDLVEPYFKPGQTDEWYIRFGRIATVGGIAISIFTALIASSYDNLMNYLQALFSIFNAPLFATFIIGMFWKRMTPAAGLWGLIAGTIAAAGTFILYKAKVIHFGSDLAESMVGASLAFVVDAIVSVLVTLPDAAETRGGAAGTGLRHGQHGRERGRQPPARDHGRGHPGLRRHPDHRLLVERERQCLNRAHARRAGGEPLRPAADHRRRLHRLGGPADHPRADRQRGGEEQGRRDEHQPDRRDRDAGRGPGLPGLGVQPATGHRAARGRARTSAPVRPRMRRRAAWTPRRSRQSSRAGGPGVTASAPAGAGTPGAQ